MKKFLLLATVTGFAAFAAPPNPNQDVQIKKVPAKHTKVDSGPEMYKAYCASCHGLSGAGNGPAASALKVMPPDLTSLTARNNGEFPASKVAQILRGNSEISSHGSADMPLWGPIFHALDPTSAALVELRIKNLTDYLKSIQK